MTYPSAPYVGPKPFGATDAHLFHGRDREIHELRSLLLSHRAVLLYGASGTGKTSLLTAGLLPRLVSGGSVVLPLGRVARSVASQPSSVAVEGNLFTHALLTSWHLVGPSDTAENASMRDVVSGREMPLDRYRDPIPLIGVIDQAEEIFTAGAHRPTDQVNLLEDLQATLDAVPNLHVLVGLRKDYLAEFTRLADLSGLGPYGRFHLLPLLPQAAVEAVEMPTKDTGRSYATGVAAQVVDLLRTSKRVDENGTEVTVVDEFVEPVQLQVVCESLWHSIPSNSDVVTEQMVRSFGNVDQALGAYYDEAVDAVAASTNIAPSPLRRWIEETFITDVDTRGAVNEGRTMTKGMPNAVPNGLEDRHVLRAEDRARARWFELAHDRFIEVIRRSNRAYLRTPGDLVPADSPVEVKQRAAEHLAREPAFDPTLGVPLDTTPAGQPPHRLVVIGDSLSHGFQSGAVFNTDISYPAIIAYELGWSGFRYPRYAGVGGLPLNMEYLLRDLEHRYGAQLGFGERALALFRAREFMAEVEDYWERGPGTVIPSLAVRNHALAVYGWDLRDALSKTAKSCHDVIKRPNDDLVNQIVQNNGERAALRVYPSRNEWEKETLFDAAAALGEEKDADTDCGIETLIVFLGANNALKSVTDLNVAWSGADFQDLAKKNKYTVWRPAHFKTELANVVAAVRSIKARHVIWCTVPHVTVAPIARGVGGKLEPGSRYFPYYARPWIDDDEFDRDQDKHLTAAEARAVDYAIDEYNDAIESAVREARTGSANDPARDWYLMDIAGLLDRLAARRYITDVDARPAWWTQYPLPAQLAALRPTPDSRFTVGDGRGGRGKGGLFSLDGVHPTTVGYGIVAQEMINIMRLAQVEFRTPEGAVRPDPVTVDFDRLILRDIVVQSPPQILTEGVEILGWADDTLDWVRRSLSFRA